MLADVIEIVIRVLTKMMITANQVIGLSVGLRAVVDPITGVVFGSPETSMWNNFAILDELMTVFPWN